MKLKVIGAAAWFWIEVLSIKLTTATLPWNYPSKLTTGSPFEMTCFRYQTCWRWIRNPFPNIHPQRFQPSTHDGCWWLNQPMDRKTHAKKSSIGSFTNPRDPRDRVRNMKIIEVPPPKNHGLMKILLKIWNKTLRKVNTWEPRTLSSKHLGFMVAFPHCILKKIHLANGRVENPCYMCMFIQKHYSYLSDSKIPT